MKDFMKSSFRGKSFLNSVGRALSPTRSSIRKKSPIDDVKKISSKNYNKLNDKINSKLENVSVKGNERLSSSSSTDNSSLSASTVIKRKLSNDDPSSSGASSQNSGSLSPVNLNAAIDKGTEGYNDDIIYESRKLLFRKMLEIEMKEAAKKERSDSNSVTDSWEDVEECFSKIYEPITNFQESDLSGKDVQKKISKMSSKEILHNLSNLKKMNARSPGHSESVVEMKDSGIFTHSEKYQVHAEVHRSQNSDESSFSETDSDEIYAEEEHYKSAQDLEVDSWKSCLSDDEVFVSRTKILSKYKFEGKESVKSLGTTKFISRAEILKRFETDVEQKSESRCSSDSLWSVKDCENVYESQSGNDYQECLSSSVFDDTDYSQADGSADLHRRVMAILATQKHIAPATKMKVMDIINEHIEKNKLTSDFQEFQKYNEEIRNKLKDALAQDWEALSNINLGLIYVPMDENGTLQSRKSASSREQSDQDTLGSLDSLIFDPKSPSTGSLCDEAKDSSLINTSRLSVSLSALVLTKETEKDASNSAVKKVVESFDDSYEEKVIHYDPKTNETSLNPINQTEETSVATCVIDDIPASINKSEEPVTKKPVVEIEVDENITSSSSEDPTETTALKSQNECPIITSNSTSPDKPVSDEKLKKEDDEISLLKTESKMVALNKVVSPLLIKNETSKLPLKKKFMKSLNMILIKGSSDKKQAIGKHAVPIEECAEVVDQELTKNSTGDSAEPQNDATYVESSEVSTVETSIDFETDSVTSMDSAIDKDKQRNVVRSDKYVINGSTDSEISDADKSISFSSTSNFESDTSWDFIKGKPHIHNHLFQNNSASTFSGVSSDWNGPRVIGNLRKRGDSVLPLPIESFFDDLKKRESIDFPFLEDIQIDNKEKSPVTLLKHHVYQSLESVKSVKINDEVSDDKGCVCQLELSNNLTIQSMNGAFVTSGDSSGDETPVIIRNGKAVEVTEEAFTTSVTETANEDELKEVDNHNIEIKLEEKEEKTIDKVEIIDELVNIESEVKETRTPIEEEPCEMESNGVSVDVDNENEVTTKSEETPGTNTSNSTERIRKIKKVGISVLGMNENDKMMKELKMKLRNKFNCEDEEYESKTLRSAVDELSSLGSCSKQSVAAKREQLAPKMSKIFGSLHQRKLSVDTKEKERKFREKQEKNISEVITYTEPKDEIDNEVVNYESDQTEIENHVPLLPTPDYTPMCTLDREDSVHNDRKTNSKSWKGSTTSLTCSCCCSCVTPMPDYDNSSVITPCPDCEPDGKFSKKKRPKATAATWSDVESLIFAEDRSFCSTKVDGPQRAHKSLDKKGSRMESYNDEDLLWRQLAQMRRSKFPEDRERWRAEKTKRMLLWINKSNDDSNSIQWCYRSHWWKAKQRASVMWIVQKANKNKVPAEFQDPYYKDHEQREHLKPGIVSQLANADLYCSALANIYGDPHFFSLSHWKVIQALARKGVYVAEPTDVALNETILLQDSPIKMSAHLAVIEAMMALYIREVVVAERVVSALQKITGPQGAPEHTPQDQEEALVLWVARVTSALQDRIANQVSDNSQTLPQFPRIQDLSDLSDGIGLAALISYYCPHELHWGDIAVADPPSMADSLYNIGLVIKFCTDALPYNPCLLTKEDIVYMHSCVKQNVLAFITEMFFLLELQPVSCVSPPNRRASATKYNNSPSVCGASSARSTVSSSYSSGGSGYTPSPHLHQQYDGGYQQYQQQFAIYQQPTHQHKASLGHRRTGSQQSDRRDSSASTSSGAILSNTSVATLKRQLSLSSLAVSDAVTAPDRVPGYDRGRRDSVDNHPPSGLKRSSSRQFETQGDAKSIKAAGAPSVRRSSSMTLNDVGGADNVGERSFLSSRPRGMIDSRGNENVGSSSHSDYGGRESSMSDGQDGDFVVQRSRGVATLNDMLRTNKSVRSGSQQEYREDDTQSWYEGRRREEDSRSHVSHEEDTQAFRLYRRDSQYGSIQDLQQTEKQPPAGIPSRFENRPAGRSRSRRNSISADESQLTVENFGGSQDNLNFADYLQRDKDARVGHVGRKDNYENKNNVIDNRLTDKLQREAIEKEKREFMFGSKNAIFHDDEDDPYQPQPTSHIPQTPYHQDVSDSESNHSSSNMTRATSFAEMGKLKEQPSGGISVNYSKANDNVKQETKKTTSFGALPNTTTWKQQTEQSQGDDSKPIGDENMEPQMMASELHNVRMKLEEKRRRIEAEKRKMEVVMNKQRQKMGKEVFMQAVQKGVKSGESSTVVTTANTRNCTPDSNQTSEPDYNQLENLLPISPPSRESDKLTPKSDEGEQPKQRPQFLLKDIGTDVTNISKKWLESGNNTEHTTQDVHTPDMDGMDYDQYNNSLSHDDGRIRRDSLDLAGLAFSRPPLPRDVDPRRLSLYLPSTTTGALPPPPHLGGMMYSRRRSNLFTPPHQQHEPGAQYSDLVYNRMTDSLSEIQGDIMRLSSQQHQIQGLLRNGQQVPPATNQQFYLHDQSSNNGPRRMYPEGPSPDQYNSPSARRAQWGPVRPVPGHIDYYHHPQQQQPGGGPMGYYPQHPGGHPQYQHLPPLNQGGFMLHGSGPPGVPPPHSMQPHTFHQNGGQGGYQYPQDGRPGAPFRLHSDEDNRSPSSLRSSVHSSPNRQILQQYPNQYYGNANAYQQQQYGQQQQQPPPPNYMSHPSNQQPQQQQQQQQQQPNIQQHHQQQQHHPPPVSSRSSVSPARSLGGSNKNLDSMNSLHAPVAAPPPDDMEPQNVSFIDSNRDERHSNRGDSEERSQRSSDDGPTTERLKRMSIGSGTRTYRISSNDRTSPTRPTVGTKTFKEESSTSVHRQVPTKRGTPMEPDLSMDPRQRSVSPPYESSGSKESSPGAEPLKTLPLNSKPDKGFYISFDDEAPVKPKPPLRSKKSSTGRKNSSQATTPVREDVNMDFPPPTTQESPIYRLSRLSAAPVGSGSGDLHSPTSPVSLSSMSSPSKRTPSVTAPTSPFKRSPLFPTTPLISPTSHQSNGFNYSSNAESSSEVEETVTPRVDAAGKPSNGVALVIGDDLNNQEECELSDMERKKQKLMYNAMKRKQQQEELKRAKEAEAELKREKEKEEEERKFKKKEEERQRRELILEKHKIKKAIDEAENEGRFYQPPAWYIEEQRSSGPSSRASSVKMRSRGGTGSRPRPKTMHEDSHDGPPSRLLANRKRGSTHNVNDAHSSGGTITVRKAAGRWGSSQSLSRAAGPSGSTNSLSGDYPVGSRTLDRRYTKRPVSVIGNSNSLSRGVSTKSLYGSRSRLPEPHDDSADHYRVHSAAPRRPSLHQDPPRPSRRPSGGLRAVAANRRYRSTGNLSGASEHDSLLYGMSEDSGLGRATPPRRAPSPGMNRHLLPSPSQPGSLPPGLITRRRLAAGGHHFDDAASDISGTSSTMDFTGPRLYKQPASKSNRPIVLNAVEFCVFPGAVNESNKLRVMEEIARSEAKHFLFLFRDAGCQFRALYSYNLETEEIDKLYGTGPKRITENMFDKFFKYNSGAKNFSKVHTKHITATIDAFTIHNSLWQGRKVSLYSKKDYALVI